MRIAVIDGKGGGIGSQVVERRKSLKNNDIEIIALGTIFAGLSVALLVQLFGVEMNPIIYIKGTIVTGTPGMIIQIVIIPSLIYAINTYLKKSSVQA